MTLRERINAYLDVIKSQKPIILVDTDEGICESWGWVEAVVTEDKAKELLSVFCRDEHDQYYLPDVGLANKCLLKPIDEYDWEEASPSSTNAVEFWEIMVV